MSRRKQANPKPTKRKANVELDELIELLNLPSNVLTIKDSSNTSVAYTVFTKIPLKRGTFFGPFKVLLLPGNKIATQTTVIQARDINGEVIYLDLYDGAGSWLKLVKLATTPQEANLSVFVEGNEIWCSVHCDTEKDVELSAWYQIASYWQPSVTTNPGFCFPNASPICTNKYYPSVSRYKNLYLEESDVKKNVTEECQDLSMNALNGGKASFDLLNSCVNSENKKDRLSHAVSKLLTSDTSSSEVKISISTDERSLDTSTSSSNGFSSGVHSKLCKLPTTLNNCTSLSTCSSDLPTSLSTGFLGGPCGITFSCQTKLQTHQHYSCSHQRNVGRMESKEDKLGISISKVNEVVSLPGDEETKLQPNVEIRSHLHSLADRFSSDCEKNVDKADNDQHFSSPNLEREKHAKMENQNTVRKTKTDLQLLSAFLSKAGEHRPLETIPPQELDTVLSSFIINVKKRNGDEYEPDSLRGLLSSVDRYLRQQEYPDAIFSSTGDNFKKTREFLRMKQLELKSKGKGCISKKHVALTDSELEKLFLSGQLGASSKDSIINTLWFYNSIFFGIRSAKRHYELRWGDITLCQLSNGLKYLDYIDQETKTPKGGVMGCFRIYSNLGCPDRDPIHIYRLYASHRPECMKKADSPFYLVPNHSKATYNSSWFKRQPLGENRLASLMKCMAKKAGLSTDKHFYNISVRRELMSKLQVVI